MAVVRPQATPAVSTTTYSPGDAVGGIMTFASVAATTAGATIVMALQLANATTAFPDLDFVLFDANPGGTFTDNAAFDPLDTDLDNIVGVVNISAGYWTNFNDNTVATINSVGLEAISSTLGSLFGGLVSRSSLQLFATTADLTVSMVCVQVTT